MIPRLLGNLERWLFEPPESIYGRPLWKLTRILRYPYALIRDVLRGDLTLRGMSLVYTTLLSAITASWSRCSIPFSSRSAIAATS